MLRTLTVREYFKDIPLKRYVEEVMRLLPDRIFYTNMVGDVLLLEELISATLTDIIEDQLDYSDLWCAMSEYRSFIPRTNETELEVLIKILEDAFHFTSLLQTHQIKRTEILTHNFFLANKHKNLELLVISVDFTIEERR